MKILAVDEQSIGEKKQSASDSATDLVVKSIVKDLVNYCVFEQEHEMLLGRATTGRLTLPRSYGRHNQRFAPTRCNAVTTSSSGHVDEPPLLSMPHSRVSAKYAERRRSMDGTNNSLLAIRLKGLQAGKVGSSVGCQTLSKLFNEIPNGVSPPPM